MAKDTRQRTTLGNGFRFLVRVLGLVGLMAAIGGGFVLASEVSAVPTNGDETVAAVKDAVLPALEGARGTNPQIAAYALVIGLALAAVWGLVELLGAVFLGAGRRTISGTNASLQVVLALALLVIVNVYSFTHYFRVDLTRDRQFTLPPKVAEELRQLNPESPTTIVVLQTHRTFGGNTDNRDSYDNAAEAKVIEKVQDLVDQFRDFGPRFRVVTLDVNSKRYGAQVAELGKEAPEMKAAIEAASENSILFHANKRVERLTFSEFYELDKTASRDANNGRGNLVLLPQGVEAFARKVLAVGTRRPRVGIAVVHTVLGTTASNDEDGIGMPGVRKALQANGFEVTDIILKRWERDMKPAADSPDENRLGTTEARVTAITRLVRNVRAALDRQIKTRDLIATMPLDRLNASFRSQTGRDITESDRKEQVALQTRQVEELTRVLDLQQKDLAEAEKEQDQLLGSERAVEDRRVTDVKTKLTKMLAEIDVLVIPRHTYLNVMRGAVLDPKYYPLSAEQAEVVRGFLTAGKPVLVAFGPEVASPSRGRPLPPEDVTVNSPLPLDPLEQVLAQAGIQFGDQVVLFDSEERAFGEQLAGGLNPSSEVPPLSFDPTVPATGRTDGAMPRAGKPNPVGEAFRVTARSVNQKLDVEARHPRPVYLSLYRAAALPFNGVIAQTDPSSWNEAKPWGEDEDSSPRFEPTTDEKDPKKGTRDEERRGPFPVGVAIEVPTAVFADRVPELQAAAVIGGLTPFGGLPGGLGSVALPPDAFAAKGGPTVRVAALGHGGLFTGVKLKPANEKLLLFTLDWLLGRESRLPQGDVKPWAFPRVELSEREFYLWRWSMSLGLPLLMGFLGMFVFLIRKHR